MTAVALPFQYVDSNGDPLAGGKLSSFVKDTTTPLDIYTDSGLTTPAANPVTLDANGSTLVYLDASLSYSLEVKNNDESETFFEIDRASGDAAPFVVRYAALPGLNSLIDQMAEFYDEIQQVADIDSEVIAVSNIAADIVTVAENIEAGGVDTTDDVARAEIAKIIHPVGTSIPVGESTFQSGSIWFNRTASAVNIPDPATATTMRAAGFIMDEPGNHIICDTRADAEAKVYYAKPDRLIIQNFDTEGDEGGFIAREVDTARGAIIAALPAANRSAVQITVNGTDYWYENSENPVNPKQFGAAGDQFGAQTDDSDAFDAMDLHCQQLLKQSSYWPTLYHIPANAPRRFNHLTIVPTTELIMPQSNITVDNTKDFEKLMSRAAAGIQITMLNGAYDIAVDIFRDKPITITAANTGGVQLSAAFLLRNSADIIFNGIDFQARNTKITQIIKNAIITNNDCTFTCPVGVAPNAAAAAIFAEGANVYLQANTRNCINDFTNNTASANLFQINYGSQIWAAGLSYYIWNKAAGPGVMCAITQGSGYYGHNVRYDGPGRSSLGAPSTIGLVLQRNSTASLLQDSAPGFATGFNNLTTAIAASRNSKGHVTGSGPTGQDRFYFANLDTGIDCTGGGGEFKYDTATTLFSVVGTNTVSDTSTTSV